MSIIDQHHVTESQPHPTAARETSSAAVTAMTLVKTKLRGWIHAFTTPLALANAIVLICLAPTPTLKWACAVFGLCSLILFGISATYHLGTWKPIVLRTLKRMDHSNIFLLIAGTYTPLSIAGLTGSDLAICLGVVWGGAIAGILMEIFWVTAPRVLRVVVYVLLGWVAVWFMPQLWASEGPAVLWLLIAGGLCYTIGAVFYAIKKPNPWPRYFGFHEFFHTGTVLGYACHAVAIWLAVMTYTAP